MKPLERIALIKKIAAELDVRMTSEEAEVYLDLSGCSNVLSSFDYSTVEIVKHALNKEDVRILTEIADELEINGSSKNTISSNVWLPGHFRLFISHVTQFKKKIALLQKELRKFGISSFVAHEDIKPTSEWIIEIENSLLTMDALAASLTTGFKESNWCDHEVGVAVGRQLLIIPIKKDLDPYGFIGKIQALQTKDKNVSDVAKEIYKILTTNTKTRYKMLDTLINLLIVSNNLDEAKNYITLLSDIATIDESALEKLRVGIGSNAIISSDKGTLKLSNNLLQKHGFSKKISTSHIDPWDFDTDDIPF